MTAMFDDQARHIAYVIAEAQERGGAPPSSRPQEAEDEWVGRINGCSGDSRLPRDVHARLLQQRGRLEKAEGSALRGLHAGINAFNALLESGAKRAISTA